MPSTPPPRIQLDSNLKRWFARNLGLWKSRRVYFFADGETLLVEMMLRVQAFDSPLDGDAAYRFTWWPEKEFDFFERKPQYPRTGSMEAVLCGHQLQRSSGYLQESSAEQSSAASQIRQVDEHELIFTSHYGDWTILEHIRLVDQDRYRSRSIYSWRHGALEIAENHHELHLEPAGELLQS